MGRFIYVLIVVFLVNVIPVTGQGLEEFNAINLLGYWQTDSVNQLSAIESGLSSTDSLNRKVLSAEMKQAIKSRSFIFQEEGNFTAQWIMGERQSLLTGTWEIEDKSHITIEINGIKTNYSVRTSGTKGLLLTPLRERQGEIYELYFIRKEAK